MPKRKQKQLEQRVQELEDIMVDFSTRLLMLCRGFQEELERKVRGVQVIRGNDGVLLGTVRRKKVS